MKRLDDFGIFDEFSIRGRWVLPADPNDVVPGELSFSAAGIRLKLDDHFKPLREPSALDRFLHSEPFEAPLLWGTTITEELVTLRRAFVVQLGSECEFAANELLVGAHLEGDGQVTSALAEFTHLDEWAYTPQFRFEHRKENQRTGVSFPAEQLDILLVENAPPFTKLALSSGVQQQLRRTELHFKVRTALRAEFENSVSIARARGALDLLTGLFSLLVGEAVYPRKLRLMIALGSKTVAVDVFRPLHQRRRRTEYSHDMVFPLSDIAADVPGLVQQWMKEQERLRPVYTLLLSTVQGADQYVQSTYLSLTQALESFHRIVHDGFYGTPDAYEEVRAALLASIPTDVSDDLRNRLETILKYGNQFSFRKRLNELFTILGTALVEKFLGAEKQSDFVSEVVDLRNYLTHHDEASSPGVTAIASDTVKMYNLNQRLRALTSALILKHLGMPELCLLRLFSIRNLNLAH